jgi:hypothetical protein
MEHRLHELENKTDMILDLLQDVRARLPSKHE